MRLRRVGGIRPFARAGAIASIALIGVVFSANAAFAATTIGSAASDSFTCAAGFDTVQIASSTGTYAVPAGGGSISSWSTQSGPFLGQVGLQVWRPTATAQTYQLVGASPLVTPPLASSLNTFLLATPIPVQAGDLLGLRIDGRAYCELSTSNPIDVYGSSLGPNPAVGAIDTFANNPTFQLDVAATVDATVTPPPPPPPTGCDSTDSSDNASTDTTTEASAWAPADTTSAGSTDRSTDHKTRRSDRADKGDNSTGDDHCQR